MSEQKNDAAPDISHLTDKQHAALEWYLARIFPLPDSLISRVKRSLEPRDYSLMAEERLQEEQKKRIRVIRQVLKDPDSYVRGHAQYLAKNAEDEQHFQERLAKKSSLDNREKS